MYGIWMNRWSVLNLCKWTISELLFVSVSKWVLVPNYCKGNEFDLHKNTQLISIWMVVHQNSLWNWGMQQLGNGLLWWCCIFKNNHINLFKNMLNYQELEHIHPNCSFFFFANENFTMATAPMNNQPVINKQTHFSCMCLHLNKLNCEGYMS